MVLGAIAPKRTQRIDLAAFWALVRRQHWVIARSQLLELGFTDEAIRHRVKSGRLHPIHRGVYAVGRRRSVGDGRFMAAMLGAAQTPFLSHSSALVHWDIEDGHTGPIHVSRPLPSLPTPRHRRPPTYRASPARHRPPQGDPRNQPRAHPCRPRGTGRPGTARARYQHGRQARPHRSGDPACCRRGHAALARPGTGPSRSRPADLPTDRLRAREAASCQSHAARACRRLSPSNGSTDSGSTSTGRSSVSSLRPMASATTGPLASRHRITCVTRPMPLQASCRFASRTRRFGTSPRPSRRPSGRSPSANGSEGSEGQQIQFVEWSWGL